MPISHVRRSIPESSNTKFLRPSSVWTLARGLESRREDGSSAGFFSPLEDRDRFFSFDFNCEISVGLLAVSQAERGTKLVDLSERRVFVHK